ncbi:hypothetical protein, partial [Nocardia niwae]|uniref:hypothetical protein n=1 Tax=Nocardia niwae TaxID=626084 RepID=UPI00340CB1EB
MASIAFLALLQQPCPSDFHVKLSTVRQFNSLDRLSSGANPLCTAGEMHTATPQRDHPMKTLRLTKTRADEELTSGALDERVQNARRRLESQHDPALV